MVEHIKPWIYWEGEPKLLSYTLGICILVFFCKILIVFFEVKQWSWIGIFTEKILERTLEYYLYVGKISFLVF